MNNGFDIETSSKESKIYIRPKWIKCSERLPEPYQWVLVTNTPEGTDEPACVNIWRHTGTDWRSINSGDCDGDYCCPTFTDTIMSMYIDEVTYWMPLPQPPEVES